MLLIPVILGIALMLGAMLLNAVADLLIRLIFGICDTLKRLR